jgi:hypothetical protein
MKILFTLILTIATSFFAPLSHAGLITKYFVCSSGSYDTSTSGVHAQLLDECLSTKSNNELTNSSYTTAASACLAYNSLYNTTSSFASVYNNGNNYYKARCLQGTTPYGSTNPLVVRVLLVPNGEGYTSTPRFLYPGQSTEVCGSSEATNDQGYCESTNPQTACLNNGGFWNSNTQSCETVPTCTNGDQYDPQTNTCNAPVSNCVNLDPNPIILSYIATDNSEVENLVLKPLSSYEYLAHQGCAYIIKTPPSNLDCFTSINDPSPKKGYCQQDYEPTFQDATNQVQAYTNLVKSTPQTCVGDEQGNQFGNCLLICNANEFRNDVTSTCDPKPTCDANQTYNATNNSCENNSCPAGQYRPTVNDPCQDEPTCPSGETSFQGGCVVQSCPSGQFRTDVGNDCVNIPVDQTYSTCDWSRIPVSYGYRLSQCITDNFNTFVYPNTSHCTITQGYHDTTKNLDCSLGTKDFTLAELNDYCQVAGRQLYWECQNRELSLQGYSPTNNFPTTPVFIQNTSTLSICPNNHSRLNNGFCQPDSCIANPNQSICNSGGSTGGTGSADLTETNNLLNGTADIPDLDTKVSDYFQNLSSELDFETDANGFAVIHQDYAAQFDNFMENSGINAIYEQYEEINPLSQIVDAQCSYNVEWDGKNYPISICDEQDDIHTVISFMLFIGLLFGLRDLIFERPQ